MNSYKMFFTERELDLLSRALGEAVASAEEYDGAKESRELIAQVDDAKELRKLTVQIDSAIEAIQSNRGNEK